jgi:hypothetical protein
VSKKVYTIEVSGLISQYAAAAFEVEAPDLSTAKEEAIIKFREMLDEKFGWYELEELKADYTKVAKYER